MRGAASIGRGRGRANTAQSPAVGGASEVSAPPPPKADSVPQDAEEDGMMRILRDYWEYTELSLR